MATLQEQVELEYQMVRGGVDRYNKQMVDLLSKDLGSKTKHGRAIIKGIVDKVEQALTEHLTKSGRQNNNSRSKALLKDMDPAKVSYLAMVCVVDSIANQSTLLKVARAVGIQIETQKRLDAWLESDREVARNMIREAGKKSDKGFDHKRHGLNHKIKADGVELPNWSNEERIHVGLRLIDTIIQHTGIIKLDKRATKRKTVWYVIPTDETNKWITAFNETNETALPRYSPCIVEPKDWDSFWGGGYHSEYINKLPFVRVHV